MAETRGVTVTRATLPSSPAAPAATAAVRATSRSSAVAAMATWLTVWPGVVPTRVPSPTRAVVEPSSVIVATATPAATSPTAPPMPCSLTFCIAPAITARWSARATVAPSPRKAFCVEWSSDTATWAPTPTRPAPPAKPTPVTTSFRSARTVTSPAAATVAPVSMYAWVWLLRTLTTTDPPKPTDSRPRLAAPAIWTRWICSRASTSIAPPAVTLAPAPMKAAVPVGASAFDTAELTWLCGRFVANRFWASPVDWPASCVLSGLASEPFCLADE